VITPSADTYVRSGSLSDENFGSESNLIVKDGSDQYDRRAFLKFDVSNLQAPVSNALLKLTVDRLPNGAPAPLTLYEAADSWREEELTWNT
jgi:hypothetical protein